MEAIEPVEATEELRLAAAFSKNLPKQSGTEPEEDGNTGESEKDALKAKDVHEMPADFSADTTGDGAAADSSADTTEDGAAADSSADT